MNVRALNEHSARIPLQRQRVEHGRRRLDRDINELPLATYLGVIYWAAVEVDGKTYNLLVDTGATDTWVSCSFIAPSRCRSECPKTAKVISYGSGDVCVFREYATIRLGGLVVPDYAVSVAIGANMLPGDGSLLLGESQGLLGLGYPILATVPSPVGYLLDFISQFSVYMSMADGESFLLLNGVDEELIKSQHLVAFPVPLKKAMHWTIGMTGFQVGRTGETIAPCTEQGVSNGSCDVIVDTGTTLLIMPPQVFGDFVNTYLKPNGCFSSKEATGRDLFFCSLEVQLPPLRFSFGNTSFLLTMEDYIDRQYNNLVYLVELQASSSLSDFSQTWVFGGTILKHFYTSYEVDARIVFYCNEGKNCDQNGHDAIATTTPRGGSSVANVTPSTGGGGMDATSPNVQSGSESSAARANGEGSGSSHTVTIAIGAAVAGIVLCALLVAALRRWRAKRQRRYDDADPTTYAMDTMPSTGDVATTTFVAAASPTSAPTR